VRIEAFEDSGACWELDLEEIERFQFNRTATSVSDAALAQLQRSAVRFGRDLSIACDPHARADALGRLQRRRAHVRAWLAERASALSIDVSEQIRCREGVPAPLRAAGRVPR
jgi:hypothetical protein